MSLIVYGASDDLIEVEGDVREEFNPGDGPSYLAISDGTVLRITYDGLWHILQVSTGIAEYSLDPATSLDGDPREDGSPCYSDRVILIGPGIKWVVFGDRFETS